MQNAGLKTIDQFCGDHALSRATFYRMLKRAEISAVKVGAATRITPEQEAAWLAQLPVVTGTAA